MRKLLYLNSLSGVIQIILGIILVFISIPLFISVMGSKTYGVFSILLIIGNLNSFTNLGITASLVKFLAEQGKVKQSNYDIFISFMILLIVGFSFSLLLFLFTEVTLFDLFKIPKEYNSNDTLILYYSLLVSNFFLFVGQIGVAVLDSLQKIYLTNILQTIYNSSYWLFIILILIVRPSLPLIGFSILLSSFIWLIILIYFFLKHWNYFEFSGIKENIFFTIRKNLNYGFKIYFSGLINFFFEPLSKILLSNFVGITEVGYYDIILRVKTQLMNLVLKVFYPIIPYISAEKDIARVRLLITDICKKIAFLIIPILIVSFYGANTVVNLWLGDDFTLVAASISYLISAYLLSIIMLPNYQYLTYKGFPGKTIIMQLSNVIVNILLFFFTYEYLAFYAIIVGNIGALIFSTIQGFYFQKKYLNNFVFEKLDEFYKWITIIGLTFFIGHIVTSIQLNKIIQLILLVVSVITFYFYFLRQFKIFNSKDISTYFGQNYFADRIAKILLK
ncbi:MAG: oligosaccharide flippase family protein [Ignavibacterium sp.]|nr:oligosaccharide flippase family protein [Ignavibacterium sp.]